MRRAGLVSWLVVAGTGLASGAEESEPDAAAAERTELAAQVAGAVEAGVRWLVENQEPSGAFGSHRTARPYEVLASVPGSQDAFGVATTGLAVVALHRAAPGDPSARAAIDRAVGHLLAEHDVKRQSGLEHYNVWAFGYALQGLAEHLLAAPDDPRADEIRAACRRLLERMESYQHLDGGWGYLSIIGLETHPPAVTSMSFTTATLLVGMERARRAGLELSERVVEDALDSIQRCRTPTGTYTYGEYWNRVPGRGINQAKGAACRTPACQYALALFDRPRPDAEVTRALEDLLVRHARFQSLSLRRPVPHESWYQISGYFYLFGQAYAAWSLEGRPEEERRRLAPALAQAVLAVRQPDGSFWDYPLYDYHASYGTAYALIALAGLPLAEG